MAEQPVPKLSVVIPVFDEGETVKKVYEGVRETFGKDCEILFIDDGSRDSTRDIISGLLKDDPALRLIAFHCNMGSQRLLVWGSAELAAGWWRPWMEISRTTPGSSPGWWKR